VYSVAPDLCALVVKRSHIRGDAAIMKFCEAALIGAESAPAWTGGAAAFGRENAKFGYSDIVLCGRMQSSVTSFCGFG